MRLKLLILLVFFSLAAFGQNIKKVRTIDSTFIITDQASPDDTLFKFTKDGLLVRYVSNAPADTFTVNSDLTSIIFDSLLFEDTGEWIKNLGTIPLSDSIRDELTAKGTLWFDYAKSYSGDMTIDADGNDIDIEVDTAEFIVNVFSVGDNFTFNDTTLELKSAAGTGSLFIGENAGDFASGAEGSVVIGANAASGAELTGDDNTYIGSYSAYSNTSGESNTFLGNRSGYSNTSGGDNTFTGYRSGHDNTIGDHNTFTGFRSGYSNTTGFDNTFIGLRSGYSNTTGFDNTFIGFRSGYSNTTGIGNIFIGDSSGYNETDSSKLYIENSASASPLIYGDFALDYLAVNGELSVADGLSAGGGDVLPSTDSTTLKAAVEAESFSYIQLENETYSTHSERRYYYDSATDGLILDYGINGKLHISSEVGERYYNPSGSQIDKGKVVRLVGSIEVNGNVYGTIALAGNSTPDSTLVLGMAATDIPATGYGRATFLGRVSGINTTGITGLFCLGKAGTIIDTSPPPPDIAVCLGQVLKTDNDSGIVVFYSRLAGFNPRPQLVGSFTRETETQTNPGQNIPKIITNGTNDLYVEDFNTGFVFVGDSSSPMQDGLYAVGLSYAFQGDAANADDWRVGVWKNSIEDHTVLRTSSSSNKGVISFTKVLSLDVGDWVTFQVVNITNGTRDSIFTDGVISIIYASEQ